MDLRHSNLMIIILMLQFIKCNWNVIEDDPYYDGQIELISLSPKNGTILNEADTVTVIVKYAINKIKILDTTYELWLGFRTKNADSVINDFDDWKKFKNTNSYLTTRQSAALCTLSIPSDILYNDTTVLWPLNGNIIMTTDYKCDGYCQKIVGRIENIKYEKI